MTDEQFKSLVQESERRRAVWSDSKKRTQMAWESYMETVRAISREREMLEIELVSRRGFRFSMVHCAECGKKFGPGDTNFGSCVWHSGMAAVEETEAEGAVS